MSDITGPGADNLVLFPITRRLGRAPVPPQECGRILLFTGVRYSRRGSDDAGPAGCSGGRARRRSARPECGVVRRS